MYGMPMGAPVYNIWQVQPAAGCWAMGGYNCRYPINPSIRNAWWFNLSQSLSMQQFMTVEQWFWGIDRDHSGSLSLNELMTCQLPGGIRLSPQTALRFLRIFDTDFSGNLGFYEFVAMFKFIEMGYNLFIMHDTNRSGTMEPHEIQPALSQMGFIVNPRTATTLHRVFSGNTRVCDMNCWIAILSFVAQCRTTYQLIFSNRYYGAMKPFNPMEFGKYVDAVTILIDV